MDLDIKELYKKVKEKYNLPYVLRNEEELILTGLLQKANILGVLPTGFGKSLCFMLYPLLLDELAKKPEHYHICIVVVPLKSLAAVLVEKYRDIGFKIVTAGQRKEMEKEQIQGM